MNKLTICFSVLLIVSFLYIQNAQAQRFHEHGYINSWDPDRTQKLRQLKPWFESISNKIIQHDEFPKLASLLENKFFSCSVQIKGNQLSNAQMLKPPLVLQPNSPMTQQTKFKVLKFLEQITVTKPPNNLPTQFDLKIFFDARGSYKDKPLVSVWLG